MMLDNSTYDKIKLLHELSKIVWFVEKHAIPDAQTAGDRELTDMLQGLHRDTQRHIESLQKALCLISQ